jgi:hypothetical protein
MRKATTPNTAATNKISVSSRAENIIFRDLRFPL